MMVRLYIATIALLLFFDGYYSYAQEGVVVGTASYLAPGSNFSMESIVWPRTCILPDTLPYKDRIGYSPDGRYSLDFGPLIFSNKPHIAQVKRVEDGSVITTVPYIQDPFKVFPRQFSHLWLDDMLLYYKGCDSGSCLVVLDLIAAKETLYASSKNIVWIGQDDSVLYLAPPYGRRGQFDTYELGPHDAVAVGRHGIRLLSGALKPWFDAACAADTSQPEWHCVDHWDGKYASLSFQYTWTDSNVQYWRHRTALLADRNVVTEFNESFPPVTGKDPATGSLYYFSNPCRFCDSTENGLYRITNRGKAEQVLLSSESAILNAWPQCIEIAVWEQYVVLLLKRDIGDATCEYAPGEFALFFYDTEQNRFVQAPAIGAATLK